MLSERLSDRCCLASGLLSRTFRQSNPNRAKHSLNNAINNIDMKTKLITIIGCLLLMAGFAFGQTQMISFDTSGSNTNSANVNPGSTFAIDTYATFSGFTGAGLSYWLQVPNALAPYISITNETYFTWTDPNQTFFVSDPF